MPEELFDRIQQYRKQSLAYSKKEVSIFKILITKGSYPNKCLKCIQTGLRWCIQWQNKFKCNVETSDEPYKKLKRLGL